MKCLINNAKTDSTKACVKKYKHVFSFPKLSFLCILMNKIYFIKRLLNDPLRVAYLFAGLAPKLCS